MWYGGTPKPYPRPAKHEGRLRAQLKQCENGGCPCAEQGIDCIFKNTYEDLTDRNYDAMGDTCSNQNAPSGC
jgi:hypothetical protein